ncbi:haloacid dehalogenase-like hydrolase [Xylariaceae sp. FL0804]|nr:haloacid dehalogenase-like hydrolase [Xylariaceae sp. FL0804]
MRRFLSTTTRTTRIMAGAAAATATPRRFAPLREGAGAPDSGSPRLQGVVFDVDGTLCEPQNHMFADMRRVLGIPKSVDILEHIYALPDSEQEPAMESIRAIERKSMAEQVAQPGLVSLMSYLDSRGIRKGICTRNFEQPVTHLLTKFLSGVVDFAPVVTRDFRPPKPDPAGILFIARSWGLVRPSDTSSSSSDQQLVQAAREGKDEAAAEAAGALALGDNKNGNGEVEVVGVGDAAGLIMVGDSIDDMTAGRRAGAATVLLVNDANRHLAEHAHTDLVIRRLDELIDVLDRGFVGRQQQQQ